MQAKLMAYEYVPLGFEVVVNNVDVEMGRIWNLWHNIKLTDDPESWDSEIKLVNTMQGRLGRLTTDQRLIRAQMAEFCRVCPLFPRSVDILCEEIGLNCFSNPAKIGCEGRDLLDSLGYHDQASLAKQRRAILSQYVTSLEKWLEKGQADTANESKIFGFLGQPTEKKVSAVAELVHFARATEPSVPSLRELTENVCKETQRDPVTVTCELYKARPFNCFGCIPEDASTTRCQCCYSMFLDASILCIGTSTEGRSMVKEFRCFVEENILAYSAAMNSWLKDETSNYVGWIRKARFVPKDRASRIAERVHSSLGDKSVTKEWLGACLLKTISGNQRWHKRNELIDSFPEATSYFREAP